MHTPSSNTNEAKLPLESLDICYKMGSASEQSPSRKDHTYVILEQNPIESNHLDLEETIEEEEREVGSNANIANDTKVGFVSMKLISALLYGACSFLITVVNKIVLTSYAFPSSNILGIGQMIAILIILRTASHFHVVTIRQVSIKNKKLWTLAAIYLGNLMAGLGGTKHLPLPMFIALRRFSIAMTAIAMIGGAFIAAAADLTFNALGYFLVMTSNLFTAANGVYTKKTIDSREINKYEILYYNALFTIIPLTIISYFTNNLETLYTYQYWTNIGFIVSFLTSCVMGYLLMFSTVLCTQHNSALTTTIVGTLKNILTTYAGMYIGGDYQYSALNFVGLNISLVGSLVYSYLTFIHKSSSKKQPIKN